MIRNFSPMLRTIGNFDLLNSQAFARLEAHLRDLIVISHEASINPHGKPLRLEQLTYVFGGTYDDKYCMHFVGLVKDLERNENTRLLLSFTVSVNPEKDQCLES